MMFYPSDTECFICDQPIGDGDEEGVAFMDGGNGPAVPICSVACTDEFYNSSEDEMKKYDLEGSPFTQDVFDIDGQFGGAVGIYVPEARWNGWAMPLFPIESVVQIAEVVNRDFMVYPEEGTWITIFEDGRVFWRDQYDQNDDVTGEFYGEEIVPTVIHGEPFYDIGSGAWCWSEAEGDA